jgi:hypothetical protein
VLYASAVNSPGETVRALSLAVLLILSFAYPMSSSAQTVERGARVRIVTGQSSQPRVGTVLSSTADSTVVQWEHTDIVTRLALDEVSQLDVSVGRRRHVRSGLVWGLTSGLLVGGIAGAVTYEPCEGFCFLEPASRGAAAAWAAGLAGVFGAGVGAIIGSLVTTDQWRASTFRTTIRPSAGSAQRLNIGLSYSF